MQLNCVTYEGKPYYIIFLPNGEKIGLKEAEALTMKMLLDQCLEDKSTNNEQKAVAFVQWLKERMQRYDTCTIHASIAEMNSFAYGFIEDLYNRCYEDFNFGRKKMSKEEIIKTINEITKKFKQSGIYDKVRPSERFAVLRHKDGREELVEINADSNFVELLSVGKKGPYML